MARKNGRVSYALCVSNRGYRASLMARRVYLVLPDPEAARRGLLRVVDESGEDYLYPAKLFVAVDLPREAGKAFRIAS
jgi:hypothetical protein